MAGFSPQMKGVNMQGIASKEMNQWNQKQHDIVSQNSDPANVNGIKVDKPGFKFKNPGVGGFMAAGTSAMGMVQNAKGEDIDTSGNTDYSEVKQESDLMAFGKGAAKGAAAGAAFGAPGMIIGGALGAVSSLIGNTTNRKKMKKAEEMRKFKKSEKDKAEIQGEARQNEINSIQSQESLNYQQQLNNPSHQRFSGRDNYNVQN